MEMADVDNVPFFDCILFCLWKEAMECDHYQASVEAENYFE